MTDSRDTHTIDWGPYLQLTSYNIAYIVAQQILEYEKRKPEFLSETNVAELEKT